MILPLPFQVCHVDVVHQDQTLLFSVGHDGRYNLYQWRTPSFHICCILSTPFTILSTPTKVFLDHDKGPPRMVLAGFQSSTLFLWDEYRQSPITTMEAGGFRRPHDVWLGGVDRRGRRKYIVVFASPCGTSSIVCYQATPCNTVSPLDTADLCLGQTFHSRTVNCAIWMAKSDNSWLLATGSEDRTMLISEYDERAGNLVVKHVLRAHTSSVRD